QAAVKRIRKPKTDEQRAQAGSPHKPGTYGREVMNDFLFDTRLDPTQRIILQMFASYVYFGRDTAWPSQQSVADASGFSLRTVAQAVKRGKELGYIRVTPPTSARGSNTYEFVGVVRIKTQK